MDRWLARVHRDRRDIPLSRKIILDKPENVAARCTDGAGVDQPAEVCDQGRGQLRERRARAPAAR